MAHIWKIGSYFFPLLYICLLCDEVLLPWNFRSPGFDIRAPQDPPKYEKRYIFFNILGLNLKISYQIVSLFYMYMDMGERIAGKRDRPSLIIEDPLQGPLNSPKYTFLAPPAEWQRSFSNCRFVRRLSSVVNFSLKIFISQKLFDNFFSILSWSFPRRVLMDCQKMDLIESL